MVTEEVYLHQLKPVITKGAKAMNTVFGKSQTTKSAKTARPRGVARSPYSPRDGGSPFGSHRTFKIKRAPE